MSPVYSNHFFAALEANWNVCSGVVCSLIRFKYIYQIASDALNVSEFAMWSILEPGIGIVANSLATLRPLVRRFIQRGQRSIAQEPGTIDKTSTTRSHNFSYPGAGHAAPFESVTPVVR